MIYSTEEIRDTVIPIAEKYRLKAVFLFGSYARGCATDQSDIDLLVDTAGSGLDTLFRLGALYDEFSCAFEKEIDMVTVASLEQPAVRRSDISFRENIIKERKNLYAVA